MTETKIKSIIFSYKNILDNIPTEYKGNSALDGIKAALHKTLESLFPTKYYALYQEGDEWEVIIFNYIRTRRKWEHKANQMITDLHGENLSGEKISYRIITFTEFSKLASGKQYEPNYYRSGLDYNDPISFSPFYA